MNEIEIIKEQEVLGKHFKVYGTPDNPLFLAKDVSSWIEHSDVSTMLRSVDDEEKLTQTLFVSGQKRNVWFLTEDGLYEVLMQSRKPIAKDFKKQVKKILNSIRKHGGYIAGQEALSDDELLAKALQVAQRKIEERDKLIEKQKKKIALDKPKTIFADAVSASETSILIGDLAKLISQNGVKIGQNRLFEWLRENGYLIKFGNSRNMPTQRAMEMSLFEIKESTHQNPDGSIRITRTPKVTGKGQIYFVNKFLKG